MEGSGGGRAARDRAVAHDGVGGKRRAGVAHEGAGGKGGGGRKQWGRRPIVGWDAWVGGEGEGAGRAWVVGGLSWWSAMGHVTCDGLVSW